MSRWLPALLVFAPLAAAAAPTPQEFVALLGHDDTGIRRAAANGLLRLGADAAPYLRKVLGDSDVEVRRIARRLLEQLPIPHGSNLPHLATTPLATARRIDKLIQTMMDWDAGRDSLDAKAALIAIGKPAFPRVLGTMQKVLETIGDDDTLEERLLESSLKLADEVLREMDGWLTARAVPTIRPGASRKYIARVCGLHHRRWLMKLRKMPEMPGPFDPSSNEDR